MQNITYRKTKSSEWVAYGPVSAFRPASQNGGTDAQWVDVTKRDGSVKREFVAKFGRPFEVDGAAMVYGYIDPSARGYDDQGRRLTRRNDSDVEYADCNPLTNANY